MSNNKNKSEETNWSEYESWVDGNLPKESISDCILRLSKQVAKLEYENARLKDDNQNLNEEIKNLDGENFKLHHKIEFMENYNG
tara:strand:+ start:131 stop:382 length:252 start_codon:yes stop_codon:yes gene_type:complete